MSEKKPFELKKMWQWLVYLYVVLPALLFLLGFLTRNMDMGILFARLFHSYCLYVVNPCLLYTSAWLPAHEHTSSNSISSCHTIQNSVSVCAPAEPGSPPG